MSASEREKRLDVLRDQVEAARREFNFARIELSKACKVAPDLVPDNGNLTPDGTIMWDRATKRYRRAEEAYAAALKRFAETMHDYHRL